METEYQLPEGRTPEGAPHRLQTANTIVTRTHLSAQEIENGVETTIQLYMTAFDAIFSSEAQTWNLYQHLSHTKQHDISLLETQRLIHAIKGYIKKRVCHVEFFLLSSRGISYAELSRADRSELIRDMDTFAEIMLVEFPEEERMVGNALRLGEDMFEWGDGVREAREGGEMGLEMPPMTGSRS